MTGMLLQMAESARQGHLLFASEKIGTVLTVVLIVFGGVSTALVLLNRRISRLEDRQRGKS